MVKRPSNNLSLCGECHPEIAANYKKSLHYTTIGQRNRVIKRMSADEAKIFDEKVFETSCRSCHASCGDCHVKSPAIGGVSLGLISKHKFVRKDEGKTCAYCHGGRVYPEYTGEYGGNARKATTDNRRDTGTGQQSASRQTPTGQGREE